MKYYKNKENINSNLIPNGWECMLPPALETKDGFSGLHLHDYLIVRKKLKDMLTNFRGDELHIIAAGGGGDLKGAILQAYQIIQSFKVLGKTITEVKFITSNLKRGEENPIGGPTPMQNIVYKDADTYVPITPEENCQHLYSLNGLELFAKVHLYDEKSLLAVSDLYELDRFSALGRPITLDGQPITLFNELFENDIVKQFSQNDNLLKQKFPVLGIEILIADAEVSGDELAADYAAYIRGRQDKVFTIGIDMGGDILARFPERIKEHDANHPEYNVRSPNTDAVFLDMFAALEAARPDNTILAISAIGGDGELGAVIFDYLRDLHNGESIIGVFDLIRFFRNDFASLKQLEQELANIPSEVSTNLLLWVHNAIEHNKRSFLDKYAPDQVCSPEVKNLGGEDIFLRGESRVAWKIPQYVTTLYLKARDLKIAIADDQLRTNNLDWYTIDKHIRLNLHYLTEMNDPNNVYARLKGNFEMLCRVFSAQKSNGTYAIAESVLVKYLKQDTLIPQLAALVTLSGRDKDMRQSAELVLTRRISNYHIRSLTNQKEDTLINPLLLGLLVHTLIQVGVTRQQSHKILLHCLLYSIDVTYTKYRGFDYWLIRTELMRALKFRGPGIRLEAKVLYDKYTEELLVTPQKERRKLIREIFLNLSRTDAPFIWQSFIFLLYWRALRILDVASPEEGKLTVTVPGEEKAGNETFRVGDAARLFAIIAEMFAALSNSPFNNGGRAPKDITDLIQQRRFKEAAHRIMTLYNDSYVLSKRVYKSAHLCFRSLAGQLGYLLKEPPQKLMDEGDIYNALLDEVKKIKHIWPIPKVAAGLLLHDGTLVREVNDIGVDEHAEMKHIIKVLRHALRLKQLSPMRHRDLSVRIHRLKERAKVSKLTHTDRDFKELLEVAKELGDPFKNQTVYVILRPCSVCVEKLRLLGVRTVRYLTEHNRSGFRNLSNSTAASMLIQEYDGKIHVPRESLLDEFQDLVVQEGFDELQDIIRLIYTSHYSKNPAAIGHVRDAIDDAVKDLSEIRDVFYLLLRIFEKTARYIEFESVSKNNDIADLFARTRNLATVAAAKGNLYARKFLATFSQFVIR